MVIAKNVAKSTGKGVLPTTIFLSHATKYGLTFTSGLVKTMYGGAMNLANQFAPGVKLGIGEYLLNQTEKAVIWGIDKTIAAQKWLKGKIR